MRRAKGEGALIKRKGCRFGTPVITMRRVCNRRQHGKTEVKQESSRTLRP